MKPMNIFDLHCDTLMPVYIDGYTLQNWTGHINLEKLQKGGSMVQCFAIYIPTMCRRSPTFPVKTGHSSLAPPHTVMT